MAQSAWRPSKIGIRVLTFVTGTIAGLIHVLSGPDHLTAVAPLAMSDGRRGWLSGWTWGIGHATGVVCVALLAVLLRDWLPPIELLSAWGERLVGVALVGVGIWAFRRATSIGTAAHHHGPHLHDHLHLRRGPAWVRRLGHAHTSFYLGIFHGLAGSSHVFGVLPALALPSTAASVIYISGFGAGTVVAMTLFAAVAGRIGDRVGSRPATRRVLMYASGVSALLVGSFWLVG